MWQSCLDLLAQELPEQQFNTWIKPLQATISDDFSRLTLVVVNRFKLDWIRAQYAARISALLQQLYGQPVQLDFTLAHKPAPLKAQALPMASDSEEFTGAASVSLAGEGQGHDKHAHSCKRKKGKCKDCERKTEAKANPGSEAAPAAKADAPAHT